MFPTRTHSAARSSLPPLLSASRDRAKPAAATSTSSGSETIAKTPLARLHRAQRLLSARAPACQQLTILLMHPPALHVPTQHQGPPLTRLMFTSQHPPPRRAVAQATLLRQSNTLTTEDRRPPAPTYRRLSPPIQQSPPPRPQRGWQPTFDPLPPAPLGHQPMVLGDRVGLPTHHGAMDLLRGSRRVASRLLLPSQTLSRGRRDGSGAVIRRSRRYQSRFPRVHVSAVARHGRR